jgi:hypothetical protein
MQSLQQIGTLVNLLRGGYANDNPACFCQCGKFCPGADACIPVQGQIHQPYWTLREAITPRGRQWAGCLYDPQESRFLVHTLYGNAYVTPCAAANVVVAHALRAKTHPLRFDQGQFCKVDLTQVEQGIAQRLFEMGYGAFLDQETVARFPHPLIAAGYRAAQDEAEAAIMDKEPGFVWDLRQAVAA